MLLGRPAAANGIEKWTVESVASPSGGRSLAVDIHENPLTAQMVQDSCADGISSQGAVTAKGILERT
jgi:hypothetical protein